MNRKYRKTIIAGNWKMNLGPAAARELAAALRQSLGGTRWCEIVLCPPSCSLQNVRRAVKGSRLRVGAQNCHFAESGAYTGEISCGMLQEIGAEYVIIGHSERRRDCGETDRTVNRKALAALQADLRPIICVGETLEQQQAGVTLDVVRMQVRLALEGVDPLSVRRLVFAYEPIWAIGTGRNATAEQAQTVCEAIRTCLRQYAGARAARAVSILYGGSLSAHNAAELFSQPDIDGGLVGGASLKAEEFEKIVQAANI